MRLEPTGAWVGIFVLVFVSVLTGSGNFAFAQLVKSVEAVGMTVADMDRSIEFFNRVLTLEKISDVEVHGSEYEKLQGIFGLRMRVVRMKLGDETISLTQYLAPEGRPIPFDWRSNDRTFQHIAIVVSDMDKAYQHLRAHKARHASTGPQTIPASNKAAAGIRAFYFKDPDGHSLEILFSSWQGRSALAAEWRPAILGHRPYGDRRIEHAEWLSLLSRPVRTKIHR